MQEGGIIGPLVHYRYEVRDYNRTVIAKTVYKDDAFLIGRQHQECEHATVLDVDDGTVYYLCTHTVSEWLKS